MKYLLLGLLFLVAIALPFCVKEDESYPWRDLYIYSKELTGDSCRVWQLWFMSKYIFGYNPNTGKLAGISTERFSGFSGYSFKFYESGKLHVSDSLSNLTDLPAFCRWMKIGEDEPFSYMTLHEQPWMVNRYYPVPQFDEEGLNLMVKYKLSNGDEILYEMAFRLAK